MSYIEDRLKEFDKIAKLIKIGQDYDGVGFTENLKSQEYYKEIKDFLRTSLEEYRKEFMGCIPEKRSKHGIYGENLATDWTMGFDDARQELLSKISQKGL